MWNALGPILRKEAASENRIKGTFVFFEGRKRGRESLFGSPRRFAKKKRLTG